MKLTPRRIFSVLALVLVGGLASFLMTGRSADIAVASQGVQRSASGATPASIQAAVDAFRADLGENNGVGDTFPGGRREINWDGVPDNVASPNALPADFFNVNSPRGAVFATPGSGFEVSADDQNPTLTLPNFGNIDPTYVATFSTFSPQRLFTAVGSNQLDVLFFVPGTDTPATVQGFGAVFTDVDVTGNTTIEYFNPEGESLGRFVVPAGPSGGLSFVGVAFPGNLDADRVARVRITNGSRALGRGVLDFGLNDLVVMDDFIYGEPRALSGY